MFGLVKFFSGMVVGAVVTVISMNLHIIRSDSGWAVVPKRYPALSDTYVDIRSWTLSDWSNHADFVWTLHKNDRQDLIPGLDGRMASLKNLFEK